MFSHKNDQDKFVSTHAVIQNVAKFCSCGWRREKILYFTTDDRAFFYLILYIPSGNSYFTVGQRDLRRCPTVKIPLPNGDFMYIGK